MIFIINWLLASFLNGLFFFLLFAFLYYWFYLKELPVTAPEVRPQFEQSSISSAVRNMMLSDVNRDPNDPQCSNKDSIFALNMMFQFLFQELKDTKAVRRYIIRKMSMEFKELLNNKTASKIIQKISARDFSLGHNIPVIHSIKTQSYQMDKEKNSLQELSVIVDIEYKNGFSISVDADLCFGRSAYVHIKIASIKGKARIQFTRHPFTHWSFSFIEDPELEFAATSQFDGRQIPQLTTLIVNQLRRSIRRKHTLPNYKCRFKPFFVPLTDQRLYKTHIDEMLLKSASNAEANNQDQTRISNNSNLDRTSDASINTTSKTAITNVIENNDANKFKLSHGVQYRKLCDKIGFDLTNVGQLVVNLKSCDRLPESLYSLNFPQLTNQTTQPSNNQNSQLPLTASLSSNQLALLPSQEKPSCKIYFTVSVDSLSMNNLMDKQICKEHWPLIEFELTRTSLNQSLGLAYVEIFFINKTEVVIQKVFPNSLAATSSPNLGSTFKTYDIVYSLNSMKISSIKQLNKIIQKAGINSKLKFVIQRPCIILNKKILTSLNAKKSDLTEPLLIDTTSSPSATLIQENLITPNDQNNALNLSSQANSITASNSSSIVSNTRSVVQKIGGRLEQRLKNSFGSNNNTSANKENTENEIQISNTNSNNLSTTPTADISRETLSTNYLTPTPQVSSMSTVITNSASSSCLVEFFCAVSESSVGESLPDLDIINLLVNGEIEENKETDSNQNSESNTSTNNTIDGEDNKRNQLYFKKSQSIKLEKENFFSFNSQPIQIEESFSFELNKKTKFINIFLWTIQYSNKMSKMKNLLVGYITLPINEISVDCWNTNKGETESTIYFKPLEELKASAISKLTKSHVLSDHPGFDANIAIGSLTINFLHKLNTKPDGESLDLSNKIAEELVEQNLVEIELNNQILNSNLNEVDDGSIHKFLNVQFNDMVVCEFCNKKIWFKNAYRCAYCGFIIHIKCYEKTIGKTICARFFSKMNRENSNESLAPPISKQQPDPNESYVMVSNEQPTTTTDSNAENVRKKKLTMSRSISPSQLSLLSTTSDNSLTSSRKLVSNFISGIRHRHANKIQNPETQSSTFSLSSKTNSFLNSLNIGMINKRLSPSINEERKFDTDEDLSSLENEDFKDMDPSEEKFFGTELFDELPINERKIKFEETIQKYQSTIEMMTKIKQDLDKELEVELKSKTSKAKFKSIKNALTTNSTKASLPSHQEYQIKSQIKHLDDQIKCVAFLLMQCQIGLDNCNDNFVNNIPLISPSNDSTPIQETIPNLIEIPKICIDQVENDGNN